jgi:hypothetical protein
MSHCGGVLVPPSSTVFPPCITATEEYNRLASTDAVLGDIPLADVADAGGHGQDAKQ